MSFLIDDFTSAPCTLDVVSGSLRGPYEAGTMLGGGGRFIYFSNAENVRNEPAHLDLGTDNMLNLTVGARDRVALQIGYGYQPDGAPDKWKVVPLGIDLGKLGSAVRTSFNAINGVYLLNFVIVVFTPSGWSEGGQNITPSMQPFSLDIPFSAFSGPGGQDFSNVSSIMFAFTSSCSLAIDKFEIV
jgi:hypothetical protein